ncbi:MAG: hypothetical protein ACREKH_18340, partial [Candidatus Rokuibacteriota bacterium]
PYWTATPSISGTTLTVSGRLDSTPNTYFTIHFYANSPAVDDPSGYGEGQRYLNSYNLLTNASGWVLFNNINITVPAGSVNIGDEITMTATRTTVAWAAPIETSEFSGQSLAVTTPGGTITGTVYEDVAGDGSIAADNGAAGVTVHLYRDGGDGQADGVDDSNVGNTATDGSGAYTFNVSTNADYWVVVDSKTVAPAAGFNNALTDPDNVWADQTYAAANATADGMSGAVRAVYYNGAYQFDTSSGDFYGGMQNDGLTTDSDNAATLAGAEHVQRVTVSGGGTVSGVDSGFSFNTVTSARGDNTDDDGVAGTDRRQQGTLRQFILNSNAIAGTQISNFSINYAGGGGVQTIQLAGAVFTALGDTVVLDATTQEGSPGGPEILVDGSGLTGNGFTLGPGADGSTIRGFVIRDFNGQGIDVQAGSDNNVIAGNYIGRLT